MTASTIAGRGWSSPFSALYLRVHPPDDSWTEREVTAVLETAEVRPPARILDLCCGYGRHSAEFARRGFDVVALDRSRELLDIGRARTQALGLNVRWIEGDMRALPLASSLDAVFNLGNAFGYFDTRADDERVLRGIHAALRPGGLLVQQIPNPSALYREITPVRVTQLEDGDLLIEKRTVDVMAGRFHMDIAIHSCDGGCVKSSYQIRLYTPAEMVPMLEEAGFRVQACFGSLSGRELTLESTYLVLVSARV